MIHVDDPTIFLPDVRHQDDMKLTVGNVDLSKSSGLFEFIDIEQVTGKNVKGSCPNACIKEHPESDSKFICSNEGDGDLIIHIPFRVEVNLTSLSIQGASALSMPHSVQIWVNHDDIDFETAEEVMPQAHHHFEHPSEKKKTSRGGAVQSRPQSEPLFLNLDLTKGRRRAKFKKVLSITMRFPGNFAEKYAEERGEDEGAATRIDFLALNGTESEPTQRSRQFCEIHNQQTLTLKDVEQGQRVDFATLNSHGSDVEALLEHFEMNRPRMRDTRDFVQMLHELLGSFNDAMDNSISMYNNSGQDDDTDDRPAVGEEKEEEGGGKGGGRSKKSLRKRFLEFTSNEPQWANCRCFRGMSLLHTAAHNADSATVQYLIGDCSAKQNLRSNQGATALHWCAAGSSSSSYARIDHTITLLTSYGTDINAKMYAAYGMQTALEIAALQGTLGSVRSLVACGADCFVRNAYGEMPLDCAAKSSIQAKEKGSFLKRAMGGHLMSKLQRDVGTIEMLHCAVVKAVLGLPENNQDRMRIDRPYASSRDVDEKAAI